MKTNELLSNVGKSRGHFASKSNRIAKLIDMWPELESKFVAMIKRGRGSSEQARMAYATLLMMETGIRTGNESSAEGFICDNRKIAQKDNPEKGYKKGDVIWQHPSHGKLVKTYGLTTLLHNHVTRNGKKLEISFVGKKIVEQNLIVRHPILLRYCPKGDKNDLFLGIRYYELKKFVKRYVGRGFTPKDIRMTKVNLIFVNKFGRKPHDRNFDVETTKAGKKKILSLAIEETANMIGHTKGVCRSSYLSPSLLQFILGEI